MTIGDLLHVALWSFGAGLLVGGWICWRVRNWIDGA